QVTISKDQNSQSTSYVYNDSLNRLKQISYPDGGQTTLSYNDTAPSPTVTTTKLVFSGLSITNVAVMDGLGHVTQTQLTTDPDGADFTDTTFDGEGRVHTRSNPHRATTLPTDGTTTYAYDALGRTTSVTEPDGSIIGTSYSGNCATVTDEAGKARKSCSD